MFGLGLFFLVVAAAGLYITWGRITNPRTGKPYQYPKWLKVVLTIPVSVIAFLGFAIMFVPSQPDALSTSSSNTVAEQPATPNPPATQEATSDPSGPPTIPGLAWVDVTLNVEKQPWGAPFKLTMLPVGAQSRCMSSTDPDTFAEIYVCADSWGDSVYRVNASITGPKAIDVASFVLPYIATIPYDGSLAPEAKKWVALSIKKVRQGGPLTKSFAGVRFRLVGNPPTAMSLTITSPALDKFDWPTK